MSGKKYMQNVFHDLFPVENEEVSSFNSLLVIGKVMVEGDFIKVKKNPQLEDRIPRRKFTWNVQKLNNDHTQKKVSSHDIELHSSSSVLYNQPNI